MLSENNLPTTAEAMLNSCSEFIKSLHLPSQITTGSSYPKIAVVGGGTGVSNLLLAGTRSKTPITQVGIVATTDDGHRMSVGGDYIDATGQFKQMYSTLGYPDILKNLLALTSGLPIYNHLSEKVTVLGLPPIRRGYFILEALRRLNGGDITSGLALFSNRFLGNTLIAPMSNTPTDLIFEKDGYRIEGAFSIGDFIQDAHVAAGNTRLSSEVDAEQHVVQQIDTADKIILAPGDLSLSLCPVLSVRNLANAIRNQAVRGKEVIYFLNYTTRDFDTKGWTPQDFVNCIWQTIRAEIPLTVVVEKDHGSLATNANFNWLTPDERLAHNPNIRQIVCDTLGGFSLNGQPTADIQKLTSLIQTKFAES